MCECVSVCERERRRENDREGERVCVCSKKPVKCIQKNKPSSEISYAIPSIWNLRRNDTNETYLQNRRIPWLLSTESQ